MKKPGLLCAGILSACILSAQPSFQTSLQAGISLPLNSNEVNDTHAGKAIHFGNSLDYTFGNSKTRFGLGAYIGYINSISADNKYKEIGTSIAERYGLQSSQLTYNASSFKSAHILVGPVASFGSEKFSANIWAKGGYGLNEPSRYSVISRENGALNNIYVTQSGENKNGLAYSAGAGIKMAISEYVALQLSAAYFSTQTDQVNYNFDREKGTRPLYYTASNQFIQASAGLQFTIGNAGKKNNRSYAAQSLNGDTDQPSAAKMDQKIKTKSNIKNDRLSNPAGNNADDNNSDSDSLFFSPQKIELRSKVSDFGMSRIQLQSVDNYLTGFVYQSANGPVISQCGANAMPGDPVPGIDVRLRRNGAIVHADFVTARTNKDGSFSFNNITPGNYTAEAGEASMDITVMGNQGNNFKTLDVIGGSCNNTKQNYVITAGDKTYVEVVPAREASSGMATGKHIGNVKYENFTALAPRDAASGMATGKRMHKPMLVANTDFDINYEKIVTEDGRYYAEVITAREAGSGMATGRRSIVVTGDVDGDGIDDNAVVSPRDAASGMPTGRRMHKPIVITKELNITENEIVSPRDATSGMATGRRMHKPFVVTMNLEDDDNTAMDAREAGSGMATGRRQYQPIVVRIYPDENSYEELVPRDAASGMATGKRMHKPFVITKELGFTADGQEVTTYKIIHRDIAARNVLTERDAAGGMPTGRRLNKKAEEVYTPWDNDIDEGVVSNPLYQEEGTKGVNPLYEPKGNLRVMGSNGKEHTILLPDAIALQNPTAVAENNTYDVQPVKWMAPESINNGAAGKSINEKGVKRSEASKKGITEKGIKMTSENMEANSERKGWDGTVKGGSKVEESNAERKGWDGTVKGGSKVEESKVVVRGWDPEKKQEITINETSRLRCQDGTCAVEGIVNIDGKDYEAVIYGVLKTRHETAKNSISNIR